ncbi:tetratricopeptide repeat protein [Methylacidimicrobium tartarophylax]|uniref:tRNA(Glu)-specific nuclease WapA n=1 Tax=Methylacidimicrobium tartarophylax TaxID=1041768 RepID=A0A5E6MBA9_9BACT|nr:hypothetical protein [Methylacidimicrobium tartarophylax]VVM06488.1 tRNA(Glu)-specific nuclease WapA [Methylacidimicrobium tartarophylax]
MEPAIGETSEVRGRSLQWLAAGSLLFLVALRLLDSQSPRERLLVAPLQPERWLALAQKRANQGRLEEAKAMLAECRREAGPISSIRLKTASLAIELGELRTAFRDLRLVFRYDPDLRRQAAYVAKATWGEDGGLRLVPAKDPRLLAAYFDLALKEQWLGEAGRLWARAEREGKPFDPTLCRRYVEALWEADQLSDARKAWETLYPRGGIVWNGGFEEDLVGWGFGWRTKPQVGVGIRRDQKKVSSGQNSLRIRLSGLAVESDHVFAEQTVLLSPGHRYELHGKGKAEEITSSSGLVLEVCDAQTGAVWATTPVLGGTTDWTELAAPIDVPSDGGPALVQIKWKGTSEWEIPTYGMAWFDELEIVDAAPEIDFRGASAAPGIRAP